MLIVLNFDAVSELLVERLVHEGRLPTLAVLRARGETIPLSSPADRFPASVFPTLYTGVSLARSGIYYPFQWAPSDQRVRFNDHFPAPPSIWERLSDAGRKVLVIDPYESRPPRRVNGLCISGWQFRNRVVLAPWSRPAGAYRRLTRRFGRAPVVDEVFGAPSASSLLRIRMHLLAGPARVAELAIDAVTGSRFDLIWLSFPSAHLAGHQFWDFSHLPDLEYERAVRGGIEGTLEAVYEAVDSAIGATLAALPEDADAVVFSALGMTVNTSRSDLLPGMLAAVIEPCRREPAPASSLWRLRAAVPTDVRAAVARRLPRRAVLELTARLEGRARDWTRVRAFALPSDSVGYIRLNVRGRERNGIVEPTEIEPLVDEIRTGLMTFTDSDGVASVSAVERVSDVLGADARLDLLPDLIVRWSDQPSAGLTHVASPEFGEVVRYGGGSGRSGNHNAEAWGLVVPGTSRLRETRPLPGIGSIPVTALVALGLDADGLEGEPLLVPG